MAKYYVCHDCQIIFSFPKKTRDYDSLDHDIWVCPHCGGEDFSSEDDEVDEIE